MILYGSEVKIAVVELSSESLLALNCSDPCGVVRVVRVVRSARLTFLCPPLFSSLLFLLNDILLHPLLPYFGTSVQDTLVVCWNVNMNANMQKS